MVTETYKARFPLFEKILVNGANCHLIYSFLRANSKELQRAESFKEKRTSQSEEQRAKSFKEQRASKSR